MSGYGFDVRLRLIEPWNGYREPLLYCPICHQYFRGAAVQHTRFSCDWLGAKISFMFRGEYIEAEVCEVDYVYEQITVEIPSEGIYVTARGEISDFPKLKVIEKPLSDQAKAQGLSRGRANRWTYY